MHNEYENYEIVDLDEAIQQRKNLIEEAKEMMAEEGRDLFREINNLKRRWRKIPYWESSYEDELTDEFENIFNKYYEARRVENESNQNQKLDIIKKAKALLSDDKALSSHMSKLMDEWKSVGFINKEIDDELWKEFNDVRQKFYDKKHQDFEKMQTRFADAKKIKEDIIERAKLLVDIEDLKEGTDKFAELMDEWKKAGRASKEFNDALWNDFNACRQKFFERKEAYYVELHKVQDAAAEKKQALIAKAQEILDEHNCCRENTQKMKELGVAWKEAGQSRRVQDEELWTKFRVIMDEYFANLKHINEQKQVQFVERMTEIRNRKNDLILKQRRHIDRLERELGEVLSETAIDEIEEEIANKKAFIAQLEAELADIESKINK